MHVAMCTEKKKLAVTLLHCTEKKKLAVTLLHCAAKSPRAFSSQYTLIVRSSVNYNVHYFCCGSY